MEEWPTSVDGLEAESELIIVANKARIRSCFLLSIRDTERGREPINLSARIPQNRLKEGASHPTDGRQRRPIFAPATSAIFVLGKRPTHHVRTELFFRPVNRFLRRLTTIVGCTTRPASLFPLLG